MLVVSAAWLHSAASRNVLHQFPHTLFGVIACDVTLADDAYQPVVSNDRKPPDLVLLHHFDGGVNVRICVDPVGLPGGEVAGHHLAGIPAHSHALEHDVPVGNHALQLAVVTADRQRSAVQIHHHPRGIYEGLVLPNTLRIRCHELTYSTHWSSFIDWGIDAGHRLMRRCCQPTPGAL